MFVLAPKGGLDGLWCLALWVHIDQRYQVRIPQITTNNFFNYLPDATARSEFDHTIIIIHIHMSSTRSKHSKATHLAVVNNSLPVSWFSGIVNHAKISTSNSNISADTVIMIIRSSNAHLGQSDLSRSLCNSYRRIFALCTFYIRTSFW